MSRRGLAAALVLALWAAGAATLAYRQVVRGPAERLALAGMLMTPGADFFEVRRDGRHVGFSSLTVDTTGTGLDLIEYAVFDMARADGDTVRMARRLHAHTTRGLKLVRFQLDEQAGPMVRTLVGQVEGDSVLTVATTGTDGRTTQDRVKLDHPVLPSSAVTFALALARTPKVGRSYDFAALDPLTMKPELVRLRVITDSVLVVSDSARLEEGHARWSVARTDTVQAWLVEEEHGNRRGSRMWIDVSGRPVHREFGSKITEQRTAYEIAYINWPGSRFARRDAAPASTAANRTDP